MLPRKIRIEYYKVINTKKDGTERDIDFPLEILILKADGLGIEKRTYSYYQERARLDKFNFDSNLNYWYLNFVRLRQTKLPVRAMKDKESVPIVLASDEYIGEDVTAVYDVDNHILALQRNRDSLSATGIEMYLTELYNTSDRGIYLRPISMTGLNDKLQKAKIFRKITLRFAVSSNKKKTGLQSSSFSKLFDYFEGCGAKTATLTMSMAHVKKGGLDLDSIKKTISDVFNTENVVTGAEVSLKNSEIDPVDTIDLFAMKYHDFLTIRVEECVSMNYLELGDKICEKYNASKKIILGSLENK